MNKGDLGYIAYQRKKCIIVTLSMYAGALVIYFLGLFALNTNKNLFTVIAVLSILPASKSAVRMIMLLRAKPADSSFYEAVREASDGLYVLYDLIFTTSEKAYTVNALVYGGGCVCLYSADREPQKLSDHIFKAISGDHQSVTVKTYSDKAAFLSRMRELKEHFGGEGGGEFLDSLKALAL